MRPSIAAFTLHAAWEELRSWQPGSTRWWEHWWTGLCDEPDTHTDIYVNWWQGHRFRLCGIDKFLFYPRPLNVFFAFKNDSNLEVPKTESNDVHHHMLLCKYGHFSFKCKEGLTALFWPQSSLSLSLPISLSLPLSLQNFTGWLITTVVAVGERGQSRDEGALSALPHSTNAPRALFMHVLISTVTYDLIFLKSITSVIRTSGVEAGPLSWSLLVCVYRKGPIVPSQQGDACFRCDDELSYLMWGRSTEEIHFP